MSEETADKPFEASEQKLRQAREKGDIPRSTELQTAAVYLGSWLALTLGAGLAVKAWMTMAARALGAEGWAPGSTAGVAVALGQFAGWTTLALMAMPVAVMMAVLVAGRGLVLAPQKLALDVSRLNPLKTAGQKFGRSGLVQFALSLAKAALVCAGGWFLFRALLDRLAASPLAGGRWIADLGVLTGQVLALALAVSVVFAGLDMGWQWFDHRRKNRMSRKEMEDEHKDSEGDPHFKAMRRQRAMDIATNRMLGDVARADVVIVNPTHYAVALEWKRGSGRAPVCLAKGTDEVAARIRERAGEHRVPIFSDPPCARAIHATVEIGQEIRREQFAAVAAAIRFAETMRDKARRGW